MGAFFFIHRPDGDGAEAGATDPLATKLAAGFRRQGFTDGVTITRKGWQAVCYGPLLGGAAATWTDEAGDVACCAGTLFYRGLAKHAALARLLADRKAGGIAEDRLYGSFAVLLAIGDSAVLFTDRTGTFHLYGSADRKVLSTSFLALAESLPPSPPYGPAVYDYVLQGASMGEATVIESIRLFPDREIAVMNGAATFETRPPIRPAGRSYATLDDAAEACVALLRDRFSTLGSQQWPAIDSALSGGYDSRLLLALARDAKLAPRLHVYGRPGDPDVVCAQAIARAEGLALHHVDKSTVPQPEPARYPDIVHANYLAFDGCPTDGIFDNGTDLDTRRKRVGAGALMLNGGGGEIFRNFFYLPDRPLRALDVVWTFYCQFDPRTCAAGFDEPRYLDGLAQRIAQRVGATDGRLTRQQVEAVYPLFRCTYWTGLNNSVNNRLGHAWTPFLDAELISVALDVPLAYKNMGRLEGRMIAMLDPALAAHSSVYGRAFDRPPGAAERLKDLASRWRPPLLRRLTYRLKRRTASPWTGPLERRRLARVIDPSCPIMSRYFRLDAVRDPEQLRRICTLEYMFERLEHDPIRLSQPDR